jgi:hypothetical protein
MANFQIVHLPLSGQQNEKESRLRGNMQTLGRTANADHRIVGELRKRKGFTRISTSAVLGGGTPPDALFLSLGVRDGELVLCGRNDVYSILANDDSIDGTAIVRRGRSMCGSFSLGVAHVGPISEN